MNVLLKAVFRCVKRNQRTQGRARREVAGQTARKDRVPELHPSFGLRVLVPLDKVVIDWCGRASHGFLKVDFDASKHAIGMLECFSSGFSLESKQRTRKSLSHPRQYPRGESFDGEGKKPTGATSEQPRQRWPVCWKSGIASGVVKSGGTRLTASRAEKTSCEILTGATVWQGEEGGSWGVSDNNVHAH